MKIRIKLNPETEARLVAVARAQGLPLEKVAEHLLHEALGPGSTLNGKPSVEEFHAMLNSMAVGSEDLPDLPTASFSRESFYEGRA